jgi:hypothetical protein
MKIKNLYAVLLLSFTTIFFNQIEAKGEKKHKSTTTPKTDIEKFLGLEQNTPSQLSTISIKYYFNNLNSPLNYLSDTTTKTAKKSKTAIFNQSLTRYVKEIYNSKYYANFISQNGTHVVDFLELSNELNLDVQSLYTCLRLFYNKIKSCELIDDTVVIQILEPLPILLEKYFEVEEYKPPTLETLTKSIEKEILFKFTEHLQAFQTEPNQFITELSQTISKMAKEKLDAAAKAAEEKEMLERLRQIIIRFFETTLSKTIWNHLAYEGIWESVISIANGLQLLGVHGILDHMDDLDDLLWSLVHRFCFFLDLAGSSLPISFYEEIESDLASKVIFFLETPEQDEGIKSKKETLTETLMRAKTKALAFEKTGLFTDQLI